jgi:hypothetical protein
VRQAIRKSHSPIDKVERVRDRSVFLFQATWERDGRKLGAKVTEKGLVAELREYLAEDEAPALIRAASLQAFRSETKTRFIRRKLVIYEVVADVKGRERAVLIAPTGHLVGRR